MKSRYHLIEPHIPNLRRYARALVRDAERADDLVQDCLVRAMSRWHLWRREGSLRSWLFTIMHNLNVNAVRRAARRPDNVPLDNEYRGAQPPSQLSSLHLRDLDRSLSRLNEEQRRVLLLVSLEGFTYEEAADICGVPIGTVMSRIARGRARLRQIMAEEAAPALRRVQ